MMEWAIEVLVIVLAIWFGAIEVLIIVIALWFAPSMVYKMITKRELRDDVPVGDWLRAAWPDIRYRAAVAWWWLWRVLAPAERRPYPEYAAADEPATPVASPEPPAAPIAEPPTAQPEPVVAPGDRAALVRQLVMDGWSVGQIRGQLKGDNNAISAEIAAARKALDMEPTPTRRVPISGGKGGYFEL